MKLGTEKTGVMVKKLKICLLVSTEYTKVTDRRTDTARSRQEGQGVHVHEIRQKSYKFVHKYNELS